MEYQLIAKVQHLGLNGRLNQHNTPRFWDTSNSSGVGPLGHSANFVVAPLAQNRTVVSVRDGSKADTVSIC